MLAAVTANSDVSAVYVAASIARGVGDPDRAQAVIDGETVASETPLSTHTCEYSAGPPAKHSGAYTM